MSLPLRVEKVVESLLTKRKGRLKRLVTVPYAFARLLNFVDKYSPLNLRKTESEGVAWELLRRLRTLTAAQLQKMEVSIKSDWTYAKKNGWKCGLYDHCACCPYVANKPSQQQHCWEEHEMNSHIGTTLNAVESYRFYTDIIVSQMGRNTYAIYDAVSGQEKLAHTLTRRQVNEYLRRGKVSYSGWHRLDKDDMQKFNDVSAKIYLTLKDLHDRLRAVMMRKKARRK